MRQRIFSLKVWGMALAAVLTCAITLTANTVPENARAGSGVAVDIENFGKVNDHFYRGGQPKGRNYEQLATLGIKTIVDLREDSMSDAQSAAVRAGLRYINLPMKGKSYPRPDAAARFLEIINGSLLVAVRTPNIL